MDAPEKTQRKDHTATTTMVWRRRRRRGGDGEASAAASVVVASPDDHDADLVQRLNRKIRRELADPGIYRLRLAAAVHEAALQLVARANNDNNNHHHAVVSRALSSSSIGSFSPHLSGGETKTTATTTARNGPTDTMMSKNKKKKKKKNVYNHSNDHEDQSGWMCGVCGLVYANERACETHEMRHIRDVLMGLGYWQPPPETAAHADVPLPAVSGFSSSSRCAAAAIGGTTTTTTTGGYHHHHHHRTIVFGDEVPLGEDGYPGLEADLPDFWPRSIVHGGENDDDLLLGEMDDGDADHNNNNADPLLVKPHHNMVAYTDHALVDVVRRAEPFMLTAAEKEAELALKLLANDKDHYDGLARRAMERTVNPTARYRSEEKGLRGTFQNKLLDAYQLMKESDGKKGIRDQYNPKKKKKYNKSGGANDADADTAVVVQRDQTTLYVNVIVKNSVQVVRHELERLARQRWEIGGDHVMQNKNVTRFERFRVYTQTKAVKLAGMALASDFTPQRIAVQLSNDLYRLLIPRLKRRGVTIETEIEYRVGPYFVLAVNIKSIDWRKLIKTTYRDVLKRQARWKDELDTKQVVSTTDHAVDIVSKATLWRQKLVAFPGRLYNISIFDAIAYTMAFLYRYTPWLVSLPICWVAYSVLGLGSEIRQFILVSVADEIFKYVESKGMEMDIKVCRTERQAAFMLSALRAMRADGEEQKRHGSHAEEKSNILGPLLGPAVPADSAPAMPPENFEMPDNLEFIGLELELPVGFKRLRWAILNSESTFVTEAVFKAEARYEKIVVGEWNKHNEHIGKAVLLPDGVVDENDFIGAEKEAEYLMPKSAFVSANMCYETHYIVAYNDHCFCLKKRARNPDAPFGKTFIAWTQYRVVNTGENSCKLTCSVEPEFPNGEPMVSRQIRSGMRAGTGELFVLIGETVAKYADSFP